ncbi:MAG: class I SAM-dependent methyltransferase [Planctomycetota bacterium]|jgi:predicted O-methyltransferase YrrM
MFKGTINEVLFEVAKQLGLQWNELTQYANEAPYAATRPDGNKWPSGTGSVSEKRILYAIARALKPELALDLGTRWGSMTMQIITGGNDVQHVCNVVSVDIESYIHGGKQPVGRFIPDAYRKHIELITVDAVEFTEKAQNFYGLIFEDTEHTYEMTKAIYELAPERLVPGGVIISHDACHPKFKGQVVAGIKATGIEPNVYLVEGDSCGLAIWQKPAKDTKLEVEIHHEAEIATEAPQEKPKRRKRRRKKASKTVEAEKIKEKVENGTIVVDASVQGLINEMSFYKFDIGDGKQTCGACKDKGEAPVYRLKDWMEKTEEEAL